MWRNSTSPDSDRESNDDDDNGDNGDDATFEGKPQNCQIENSLDTEGTKVCRIDLDFNNCVIGKS